MPRATKLGTALALLGIAAWGSAPFLCSLRLWPIAPDSVLWITRGALDAPDWERWVFATHHFGVGYRPLTALSYTLTFALAGYAPLAYRLTDLLLHASAGLLVFALFRALFRDAPRWAALVAAAIFLCHPAVEQVVPWIARRSYSLATVLSLGALLLFCRSSRRGASLAVGLLFAAAVLSNEVSVVAVAMLPWLARLTRSTGVARACAIPWLAVLSTVLLRTLVLGGLGGYEIEASPLGRAPAVFAAALGSVFGGGFVLVAIAPYYAWRTAAGGERLWLLAVWLVAYAVLYASLGVWFPRQAYPMLVPFSLLCAAVLAETPRLRTRTRLGVALQLAPQLALLALLLAGSAALRGQDPERLDDWRRRDALLSDILREAAEVPEPASVRLVLPYRPPGAHAGAGLRARSEPRTLSRRDRYTRTWIQAVLSGHDVVVEDFLLVEEGREPPHLETSPRGTYVVIPPGKSYFENVDGRFWKRGAGAPRRVRVTAEAQQRRRNRYLFIDGRLVPLA